MPASWIARVLLIVGFVLHAGLAFEAARVETPTVDEFAHVPAGLSYWRHGSFELYSKNPPLIKLWMTAPLALDSNVVSPPLATAPLGWGPWLYGETFQKQNSDRYLDLFTRARFMVILLSLATGLLIFAWARQRFDETPAALAAFAFWLSPTVLAHGHLATVDVGSMFTVTLFCFLLSRARPRLRDQLAVGASLGLALAAKFTAVFLLPWLAFWTWRKRLGWKFLALTVLCALLALNLSYGFKNPIGTVGDFNFQSNALKRLPLPPWFPVPVAKDFVEGFDAQTVDAEQGEFGSYLLGEWSRSGWWYYNALCFLMKEHLATILLLLLSPLALLKLRRETLSFAGPLLAIGLPLSLFSSLQLGIRYLLPIYPFLFILIAASARFLANKLPARAANITVSLLAALWTFTAVTEFPSYLSYFNPAALRLGDKADLLLDSNLDWGQDLYRLKGINQSLAGGQPIGLLYFGHVAPSAYGIDFRLIPNQPVRGVLAVSTAFLRGYPYVAPSPEGRLANITADHLKWLAPFKPIRQEGSIAIFDTRQ